MDEVARSRVLRLMVEEVGMVRTIYINDEYGEGIDSWHQRGGI